MGIPNDLISTPMNIDRIVKYCERMIEKEKSEGLFSKSTERITALEMVLDFIKNADNAKEDEVASIKRIFQFHYNAHLQTVNPTTKPYVCSFTKKEDKEIKDNLIPHIKREMATNEESYTGMSVADFFEAFMQNLPVWWKKHQFTIPAISKHFQTIYTQIVSGNNKMGSTNGKPSIQDVFSDLISVNSDNQPS